MSSIVAVVPITSIEFGDRARVDYGEMDKLIEAIRARGLIQPLAVKKVYSGYLLLAGGRRYKACQLINEKDKQEGKAPTFSEIPVRIFPENLDKFEQKSIELMENLERRNLSWTEQVSLVKQIQDLHTQQHGPGVLARAGEGKGWTQKQTAELLNELPSTVSADLKLASAMESHPELARCETKGEAMRKLDSMKEELIRAELARRVSNRIQSGGIESMKKRAIGGYRIGDFLEAVKLIPDDSVDGLEVDPPYGVDFTHLRADQSRLGDGRAETVDGYHEIPVDDYSDFLKSLLSQCYRILKPDCWMIFWFGTKNYPVVASALTEAKWKFNPVPAMWFKCSAAGMTAQPNIYLGNAYETFFYAYKGRAELKKKGRANVFEYQPPHTRLHPAEKPLGLMTDILATFFESGSTLLSPFLGSGVTIMAAIELGMTPFGFDLSEKFQNAFIERVMNHDFVDLAQFERANDE